MSKKRNPKKGYVYLLKCKKDPTAYKYGCTTLHPQKRCLKINSEKKGRFDFEVIASFKSFDVFSDENNMKWNLLPFNAGAFGEIFYSWGDMVFTKEKIIYDFLVTGGVINGGDDDFIC